MMRPSFTDSKTALRADFDAIRISLASPEKIEQGVAALARVLKAAQDA